MTFWEQLTNKPVKIEKVAKSYEFASPDFISTFIKTAADLGCTEDEVDQHLDTLEKNYRTTNR